MSIYQYSFSQSTEQKQDSTLISVQDLKEIAVSATKELHKLKALPSSVSLVSSNKIEQNSIESLKDLSSYIPNLFMPDYGSKLTSPIYIRGIGSKINSPSVGLYVDGVPYFEKASFDFNFSEIENIEVLRGPQGTLYGRNTMGGIINIKTKSPENYTGSTIKLTAGEYGNRSIGAATYNTINDKFSYSFSSYYGKKGGFFTNKFNNEKADNMEQYNVGSKIVYTPSDSFKSVLSINYQGSKQGGYPYGVYNKETGEIEQVNYNKYSSYDRDMLSTSLYNEYKTENILFSSSTSYNYFTDHQAIDQDFKPVDIYFVNHKQNQHMFSQEFTLKSLENKAYKWVFGAFAFHQSIKTTVDVEFGDSYVTGMVARKRLPEGTTSYAYVKNYDIPTSGAALFHQSSIDLGKLNISAGIRLDYESTNLDYSYFKTLNTTESKVDEKDGNLDYFEVLPKASVKYSFNSNNFIYTTIAKGYKTGGYNTVYEKDTPVSFNPEHSWNYEAGIKTNLLNNRLFINMAAFYIEWKNQQISQTVPSGQGRIQVNAGESVSKGIELESRLILIENLELQANYGYTEAKFVDYKDEKKGKKLDYSNNYIPYVPKQTISLALSYRYEINSKMVDAVKFNTIYKAFDEHYWNVENSIKQGFYDTIDAKISFIKDNFAFDIWAKNISNSEYIAYHFSSMGIDFAQKGKPSQVGVSLKYSF